MQYTPIVVKVLLKYSDTDFSKILSLQRMHIFAIKKRGLKKLAYFTKVFSFVFPTLLLSLSRTPGSFKIVCSHYTALLSALCNSLTPLSGCFTADSFQTWPLFLPLRPHICVSWQESPCSLSWNACGKFKPHTLTCVGKS